LACFAGLRYFLPVIREYITRGLERARYERLEDGSICATVQELRGVIALGSDRRSCRRELAEVLEAWVLVRVSRGLSVPELGGVVVRVRRLG